jgi:monoamine oxidase
MTPQTCAAEVTFEPPLPAAKAEFLRGYNAGVAVKAIALYQTPFWLSRARDLVAGPSFHDGLCTNIFHTTASGVPGLVGTLMCSSKHPIVISPPLP